MFKDPRYLKVDNKPVLIVYRPTEYNNSKIVCDRWRELAKKAGLPGIHLITVDFYGVEDPRSLGFDAALEFPPHKFIGSENVYVEPVNNLSVNFNGSIVDYRKIIAQSLSKPTPEYLLYRGIIPSWDNTARRQNDPLIVEKASPELYEYWLKSLIEYTRETNSEVDQLIFINAWNEWGEGCHLEPDLKYGRAYLEATKRAKSNKLNYQEILSLKQILSDNHINQIGLAQENRLLRQQIEVSRISIVHPNQPKIVNKISNLLKNNPRLYKLAQKLYHFYKRVSK